MIMISYDMIENLVDLFKPDERTIYFRSCGDE